MSNESHLFETYKSLVNFCIKYNRFSCLKELEGIENVDLALIERIRAKVENSVKFDYRTVQPKIINDVVYFVSEQGGRYSIVGVCVHNRDIKSNSNCFYFDDNVVKIIESAGTLGQNINNGDKFESMQQLFDRYLYNN